MHATLLQTLQQSAEVKRTVDEVKQELTAASEHKQEWVLLDASHQVRPLAIICAHTDLLLVRDPSALQTDGLRA